MYRYGVMDNSVTSVSAFGFEACIECCISYTVVCASVVVSCFREVMMESSSMKIFITSKHGK